MQKILRTDINKTKNSQDFCKVIFLMNGKKQIWFQSIKKVVRKCQETTDLFHYFQYVEKYSSFYYNIKI